MNTAPQPNPAQMSSVTAWLMAECIAARMVYRYINEVEIQDRCNGQPDPVLALFAACYPAKSVPMGRPIDESELEAITYWLGKSDYMNGSLFGWKAYKTVDGIRLPDYYTHCTAGPWVITEEGYGATRIIEGGSIGNVAHRVAFIEKTPRVRIRDAMYGGKGADRNTAGDHDWMNWAEGPFKGSGMDDEKSRKWCDDMLRMLGYRLL